MTIEEMVVEKLRGLPPEKQKKVLQFVESLKPAGGTKKPLRSLEGLWANLDISITEEDIPRLAARCGATSRETSNYDRGARYPHRDLVSPRAVWS